jgi:hypothetical protein
MSRKKMMRMSRVNQKAPISLIYLLSINRSRKPQHDIKAKLVGSTSFNEHQDKISKPIVHKARCYM